MPYRDAIETVRRRCDELAIKLATAAHESLAPPPSFETLAEALAWEARARKRIEDLEERIRDDAEIESIVHDPSADTPDAPALTAYIVMGAVIAISVVVAFAMTVHKPKAAKDTPATPPRFTLIAGDVVTASPPARAGDRCTVRIDADHDGCDIDVICPTDEERLHGDDCFYGDVIRAHVPGSFDIDTDTGHLALVTKSGGTIAITLSAWR